MGAHVLAVVHCDNAHRTHNAALQDGSIFAGILVHPDDAVQDPVGEEKVITEQCNGERMLQEAFDHYFTVLATQVAAFNLIQPGVSPVQLFCLDIQHQTVGHQDVLGHHILLVVA